MKHNEDKIDEMMLALLYLTTFKVDNIFRAWKSMDWNTMNRIYEKGFINNPRSKAKSVVLSEEGARLSKELFEKHFGVVE